jgi:hypothetical protein
METGGRGRREEGEREGVVALTVVVQGILKVVEVQELVSSFADEVERILEQGQERLEWNQDVGCDGGAMCLDGSLQLSQTPLVAGQRSEVRGYIQQHSLPQNLLTVHRFLQVLLPGSDVS